MTQAGFYSIYRAPQGDYEIHYAPNFVTFSSGLTLLAESHDQYQYPVDGWSWFENENQARAEFGVELLPEE
jgi:hypothetical protein